MDVSFYSSFGPRTINRADVLRIIEEYVAQERDYAAWYLSDAVGSDQHVQMQTERAATCHSRVALLNNLRKRIEQLT